MLDPFIEAIKTILANPASRAGPIELCRTRRVRAMGKRVTFRLTEAEDGSRRYEPEAAVVPEPIPAGDFTGADILEFPNGLHLSVSRMFVGRELLGVLKGWEDVVFDVGDLRDLFEEAQARNAAAPTRRQPRRDEKRPEIRKAILTVGAWQRLGRKISSCVPESGKRNSK